MKEVKCIQFAENFQNKDFVIGETDCNIMVLEYLDYMYSTEIANKVKNKYSTFSQGAKIALKELCCSYMDDYLKTHPNVEVIEPMFASCGDIIVKVQKKGKTKYCSCAIHLGTHLLIADDNNNKTRIVPNTQNAFEDVIVFRLEE